jgi:hypothetical protein
VQQIEFSGVLNANLLRGCSHLKLDIPDSEVGFRYTEKCLAKSVAHVMNGMEDCLEPLQ